MPCTLPPCLLPLLGAELEAAVQSSLRAVNLWANSVADKQARQYSGGMKRRLSVAISFIGDPLVVYMDEPSTVRMSVKVVLYRAACRVGQGWTACVVMQLVKGRSCQEATTSTSATVASAWMLPQQLAIPVIAIDTINYC